MNDRDIVRCTHCKAEFVLWETTLECPRCRATVRVPSSKGHPGHLQGLELVRRAA